MRQQSLTDGFEKHRKKTRKERFLEKMDQIIPWQRLSEAIRPHYPVPKGAGRRPLAFNTTGAVRLKSALGVPSRVSRA